MEVAYDLQEREVGFLPAKPRLVLNNPTGRAAYTHQIDVDKHFRTVLLNRTRFLLLDSRDGTEIAERAGKDFRVSPTHRFITVENNGAIEVIDVLDGSIVRRARKGDVMWALGDSFVATTTAPWGEVNLHSTFSDGFNVREQVTGPSCCPARPETTRLGIDLENAVATIWGTLGHWVGALQNPGFYITENAGSGWGSESTGSEAAYHLFYSSVGPLAPATLSTSWQVSGGFAESAGGFSDDWEAYGKLSEHQKLDARLSRVGLNAVELHQDKEFAELYAPGATQVRSAGNANELTESFEDQLGRIGIGLGNFVQAELLITEDFKEYELEPALGVSERIEKAYSTMERLRNEAAKVGMQFDWTIPDTAVLPECYHVNVGSETGLNQDLGSYVPNDVTSVSRAMVEGEPIWVTRSECVAGATYGSLRGQSLLLIYDLGRPYTGQINQVVAAENSFLGNTHRRQFFEHESRFKADTDHIIIYTKGAGVASVYDRDLRDFIYIGEQLPDGDLLEDAWLTDDARHMVQLNSDGAFHLHRLSDSRLVLSGRIVDDEIAVWTETFQYDATAEAAALIDLTFPGKPGQFSLDRFGKALFVPGLAGAVLAGAEIGDAPSIEVPPDIEGQIDLTPENQVKILVNFEPGQVSTINLFQDGVLTDTVPAPSGASELQVILPRLKDARWATVIATGPDGLASLPISTDMGEVVTQTAKNRALIVGVNTYDDPQIASLNYALRDAGRFARTLLTGLGGTGPSFSGDDVIFQKDTNVSAAGIVSGALQLISGLEKGDHAVLYFAGHGLLDLDGNFYLGVSGTSLSDLPGTSLAFSDLASVLSLTQARITVILDACHSGLAGTDAFATNDDAVKKLTELETNLTILAAAKGREFSQEVPSAKGGLFTVALEQVLSTDRARYDVNGNGRIEADELYSGVKALVVGAREERQTPWIVRSRMVGDYALF